MNKKAAIVTATIVLLLVAGVTLAIHFRSEILGFFKGSKVGSKNPLPEKPRNDLPEVIEPNCQEAFEIEDKLELINKALELCKNDDLSADNFTTIRLILRDHEIENFEMVNATLHERFPGLFLVPVSFQTHFDNIRRRNHIRVANVVKFEKAGKINGDEFGKEEKTSKEEKSGKGNNDNAPLPDRFKVETHFCNYRITKIKLAQEKVDYFNSKYQQCEFKDAAKKVYLESLVQLKEGEYQIPPPFQGFQIPVYNLKSTNFFYIIRNGVIKIIDQDLVLEQGDIMVVKSADNILEETGFNSLIRLRNGNLKNSKVLQIVEICRIVQDKLGNLVLEITSSGKETDSWNCDYPEGTYVLKEIELK